NTIVLDLNLPDIDGLTILRRIRTAGKTAPVLITSLAATTSEHIAALNAGADDYLRKPFEVAELAARLHALLRRPREMVSVELHCSNLRFVPQERTVSINDMQIALPRREASILEHLLRNVGRTIAKSMIEDRLYAFGEEVASNSVEVHV